MKLRPILNPDHPPRGDLFNALNWYETLCRMRGVTEVSEDEVVRHLLEEEGRADLAMAFSASHLCELPDAPQ